MVCAILTVLLYLDMNVGWQISDKYAYLSQMTVLMETDEIGLVVAVVDVLVVVSLCLVFDRFFVFTKSDNF